MCRSADNRPFLTPVPQEVGRRWRVSRRAVSLLIGPLVVARVLAAGPARAPPPRATPTGLHVAGNRLVDGSGATVRLQGFNTSGTEYACIEGTGIFDLPGADGTEVPDSVVERMARWQGANAVRVPLNEQCWLGLGVDPAYGGAAYQRAVADYVRLLHEHGFVVVLDLHRSAPADGRSLQQEPMPDRDHS